MTEVHTVYRCYDTYGHLLYVGVTSSIPRRFAAHSTSSHWWAKVDRTTEEHFASRAEALTAEECAIRAEVPRHNVRLVPSGESDALGRLIARQMDDKGMSRHDLSRRCGYSMKVLDRVLNDTSRMKLSTLARISAVLDFDVREAVATWEEAL